MLRHRAPYRNDVIGTVVPGRKIRLRDPVSGEECPNGHPGQLGVWGVPGIDLFEGYLDDPATTAAAFSVRADGVWFDTGDLVTSDADGVLRFAGRTDDIIKVAGENVSLVEIETALSQAPGVLEAAVVARPDTTRDTVTVAYVVPRDSDDPPQPHRLDAWAADNLAPAARPKKVAGNRRIATHRCRQSATVPVEEPVTGASTPGGAARGRAGTVGNIVMSRRKR